MIDYVSARIKVRSVAVRKLAGQFILGIRLKSDDRTSLLDMRFDGLDELADFLQACNGAYHSYKDSLLESVE